MILKNETLCYLNVKNTNGHIYNKSSFDKLDYNKEYFGIIDFHDEINLRNVAFICNNLRIIKNKLIGDIKLLKTERGNMLKILILNGENDISYNRKNKLYELGLLNKLPNLIKIAFRITGVGIIDDNGLIANYHLVNVSALIMDKDPYLNIKINKLKTILQ